MSCTTSTFNSINNWFDKPVTKIMKFRDFDLFAANCEKQCRIFSW